MFIKLIQVMLAKRTHEGYNMVEVEMILNYFPHQVWRTEDDMKHLRDKFYAPVMQQLTQNLDLMPNRQFISVFQGLSICGQQIFTQ